MDVTHLVHKRVLAVGGGRCMLTTHYVNAGGDHVLAHRVLPGYLSIVVVAATLRIPDTVFARDCLDFLNLKMDTPLASLKDLTGSTHSTVRSCPCHLMVPTILVYLVMLTLGLLNSKLESTFSSGLGWKSGRVDRRGGCVLRMGSLRADFTASTKRIHTMGNISFGLRPKGALKVMKRSNSNGSIASCSVVRVLTRAKGVAKKRILCHNRSVSG